MTGHYLAEFSCSYRPVKHGRPGVSISVLLLYSYSYCSCEQIGATHCKQLFALSFSLSPYFTPPNSIQIVRYTLMLLTSHRLIPFSQHPPQVKSTYRVISYGSFPSARFFYHKITSCICVLSDLELQIGIGIDYISCLCGLPRRFRPCLARSHQLNAELTK